ncbi:MAG: glycine--tRNA ligase subunit beta, partial [Alphaproteobacteria bacterium]
KSMRWGNGETSWVRPLHSILCIFDGDIVDVEFAGVKAGNTTYGHRFLSPAAITINDPAEYEKALQSSYVMPNREQRMDVIFHRAQECAWAQKVELWEDKGLLEEVTGLVEWPVLLTGTIDSSYMDLPEEVLVSEMRNHQKYFATKDANGKLADKFIITANMKDADKAIIAGNERVLRARLADGRFFWDTDRKKKLEDMAEGLKAVTYHAKLGSVADKVARIEKLANEIMPHVKASKDVSDIGAVPPEWISWNQEQVVEAAQLCKADLVSGMVGEFPELQGVMGCYYALEQDKEYWVSEAIHEHYLPLGPTSRVPNAPISICVALADKLDTLVSMFAIGEKPTGSKDPFALRRAALGVIRIILENDLRLPLSVVFDNAPLKEIAIHKAHDTLAKKTQARLHEAAPGKVGKYLCVNETACEEIPEGSVERIGTELLAFFHDRLIVQLKDQGIRHDVIKAVVADGDDDLVRIVKRAKAVQAFLDTDDGKNLLAGYKRAVNILAIEEKKDNTSYKVGFPQFVARGKDVVFHISEEEKELGNPLSELYPKVQDCIKNEQYQEALIYTAQLKQPVYRFFENVRINDDNPDIRKARLTMLSMIRQFFNEIADFSKIEGDTKEQKKAA